MQESLSALALFFVIIAIVLLYVFRKQILTVAIFLALAFVGFLFFKNATDYPVSNDLRSAEQSISGTISKLWQSIVSGYTTAQSMYKLFTANDQIQQQFAESDTVTIINSVTESYEKLKNLTTSLPTIDLPSTSEVEQFSDVEKTHFLQTITELFTSVTIDSAEPIQDEVPTDAVKIAEGLFTNELALTTAQGLITQYQLDSGVLALYFKELKVPFGPELGVYLAEVQDQNTVLSDEFLFVSPLKAVQGNQLYFLPNDERIQRFNTVFIYSSVLNQVYAIAPLR